MPDRIGTAAWAENDEVEEKYGWTPRTEGEEFYNKDGAIWLGRSARGIALSYHDDRHVCLVGGTRAGKGTTGILPTLLTWHGSVFVIDPKGENATVAARRRSELRHFEDAQAVYVLDPFRIATVREDLRARLNPLDLIDMDDDEAVDHAGRIADALVEMDEGGGKSRDPFWDESARGMIKALILHIVSAPVYEGRRNLITLRSLILQGDADAAEELRSAGDDDIPPAQGLLWMAVGANPAFGGTLGALGKSFSGMFLDTPKVYESVLQTASRNTEFIDSPAMRRVLETSDFRLAEMKTRPEGASVFLCLPQRYMNTHYRWLRMIVTLAITEMEIAKFPPSIYGPKAAALIGRPNDGTVWRNIYAPVLMILDEFPALRRMRIIENAVAQIAGYGVKLFFVLQSLEQLKAVYRENWETFLANAGLKIFFNLEDHFSRDYVSKLIGETELMRETRNESDSTGETEGLTHGTSDSYGDSRSVSEGTSHSTSTSRSGGTSTSRGSTLSGSDSFSFRVDTFLGFFQQGPTTLTHSSSYSTTNTDSVNEGWSNSLTEGSSETRGHSLTRTTGTSESVSSGTSRNRSAGKSETLHRRALINPDEIGRLFARIEKGHPAYPGLALALISGQQPVVVRRTNYFEDPVFAGLFDAHPDHPLPARPPAPKALPAPASAVIEPPPSRMMAIAPEPDYEAMFKPSRAGVRGQMKWQTKFWRLGMIDDATYCQSLKKWSAIKALPDDRPWLTKVAEWIEDTWEEFDGKAPPKCD